jgi:hypothetical protein
MPISHDVVNTYSYAHAWTQQPRSLTCIFVVEATLTFWRSCDTQWRTLCRNTRIHKVSLSRHSSKKTRRLLSRRFSCWRVHITQLAQARMKSTKKVEAKRSLHMMSAALDCWKFLTRRPTVIKCKLGERDLKRTANLLRGAVSSWRDATDEAADRKKRLAQNDWGKHMLSLRVLSVYFSLWKDRIARALRMTMLETISHKICAEVQSVLKTAFLVRNFEHFTHNPPACAYD